MSHRGKWSFWWQEFGGADCGLNPEPLPRGPALHWDGRLPVCAASEQEGSAALKS